MSTLEIARELQAIAQTVFHCEIVGGSPKATSESSASRFFARDAWPELSTSRALPAQLERFFDAVTQGTQATECDGVDSQPPT